MLITQDLLKKVARYKKHYRPGRNQPCLCGSSKKYKHCCAILIDAKHSSGDYLKLASTSYGQNDFPKAEKFYRAHLTQYLIWYKEHTEPLLARDQKAADELLTTDIEAITEIAISLAKALHQQQKQKDISALFKALSAIKINSAFAFYIDCQKSFWATTKSTRAQDSFLKKHGISVIESIPLTSTGILSLSIFLDEDYYKAPAHLVLMVLEKILTHTSSAPQRLELLTKKTRIALLQNDTGLAQSAAKAILGTLDSDFKDKTILGAITTADAYYIAGIALEEASCHKKAISICTEALKTKEPEDISSSLHYLISKAYAGMEDHKKSIEALHQAINIKPSLEYWLDLAQEHLILGDTDEAYKFLSNIKQASLPEPLKVDFITYKAHIAVKRKDLPLAREAERELEDLKVAGPYFQLLIGATKRLLSDFSSQKEDLSIFVRARSFIAKYLILQPNFFGIGINLNEVLKPDEPSIHRKKELNN